MRTKRNSGILLHPTSLPGPHGIGDLGSEAYRFADFLAEAGQTVWQVLPLGPTGYGDSPYQSFSAFAGNPMLISLESLCKAGYLTRADLDDRPRFPEHHVDYGALIPWKTRLLQKACYAFLGNAPRGDRDAFEAYCDRERGWLDDFALFMALKQSNHMAVWTEWDAGIALRDSDALAEARRQHAHVISAHQILQFLFEQQWKALREHCTDLGIQIIGDIPIYAAHDSADVWAHRDLFQLDPEGRPLAVGGVPPDYFCETGQLWGNPVYNWQRLADTGYIWWIERMRRTLTQVDIVRLDHFRGFESYWEVPADEETAINGQWKPGPCAWIFDTFRFVFGDQLPIIAENLGVITPEVEALREQFTLPGMAVFQFGFGPNALTSSMPLHEWTHNLVAYTGTHDNDTLVGWWRDLEKSDDSQAMRDYITRYLRLPDNEIHWEIIRAVSASVADTVVFPMQDPLGLDSSARMNRPGDPAGNWQWRCPADAFTTALATRLRDLTEVYGRLHDPEDSEADEAEVS